jgi:hypothetical protein
LVKKTNSCLLILLITSNNFKFDLKTNFFIGSNKYCKNFIINLSIIILSNIIVISIIVGIKYVKNMNILLGNHSTGSIIILPINATITAEIPINKDNHEALSGLGIFDLRIFNKILPIQNKLITDKNEIV